MVKFALCALLAAASLVSATPPGIPSTSDAKTQFQGLTVAEQGSQSGYSRSMFGGRWISQGNSCNTRDVVLKRDGTGVVQGRRCSLTGSWYSPYDGATWTATSDIDIDHVVPLSNAWKSGASNWNTTERQAFANDLTYPQLIAVTDSVNQQKKDYGPERWKPPLASYHCTYAKMWVRVKDQYNLTVKADEYAALEDMLATC